MEGGEELGVQDPIMDLEDDVMHGGADQGAAHQTSLVTKSQGHQQ